jgi:uncharacterized RDD family membrane protein YckC
MPDPSRPSALLLRRLGAALYDALIGAGLIMGVGLLFTGIMGGATEDLRGPGPAGQGLVLTAVVTVLAAYFIVSWSRGGQTVGMRPWRLKVVAADGAAVTPRAAAIRLAAALLSWAPAGLGFWWALVDRERLTWHDRLSATHLVRLPKADSPHAGKQ